MDRVVSRVLLLLALAAACAPPDRPESTPPEEPGDPAAADPAMARTSECVNPAQGYALEYPAAWHVNPEEIMGPCALFDPDPFEVPRNSEIPIEIAIMIGVEPVPIATLSGDMLGRLELARSEGSVGGREAVRIDGETTGEGLHPAGIRSYEYFVDLGDSTLVAATYDAGTLPFERRRRILDAMMATLELRGPG